MFMIKKYKTRPCEIEVIKWDGNNFKEIAEFTNHKAIMMLMYSSRSYELVIETLEGNMMANVGDFIIKGLKGEFYPCKPDVFHKKYEEV